MTIGQLPGEQMPRVEMWNGQIAIWAGSGDGEDTTGLLLSPQAAVDAGMIMLALGAKAIGEPVYLQAAEIEIHSATDMREESAARLIVTAEGAPLAIDLSATQFVEFAAAMAALARQF